MLNYRFFLKVGLMLCIFFSLVIIFELCSFVLKLVGLRLLVVRCLVVSMLLWIV